jgi:hypothetical protein
MGAVAPMSQVAAPALQSVPVEMPQSGPVIYSAGLDSKIMTVGFPTQCEEVHFHIAKRFDRPCSNATDHNQSIKNTPDQQGVSAARTVRCGHGEA